MKGMEKVRVSPEDKQALEALKQHILREGGIDCAQYKENFLMRRLHMRMRATLSSDYLAYMKFLRRHPEEYRELVKELTINVTEFFRDAETWVAIKDRVVPDILESKLGRGLINVRAWSAGCATGEEAYSLAICCREAMRARKEFSRLAVKIYATDLDRDSLRTAKRGVYSKVATLPGVDIHSYFERAEGAFEVSEELKGIVKFEESDVMAPPRRRYLDLIVCRNLLIYFNKESQVRVLGIFRDCLREGGYLVVGRSEALLSSFARQFTPVFRRERIYRKEGEA